ncbi:MAG: hypothetical protein JXN65_01205 [Clostridia bacterium]|nr:hypothetical protein [Clostridia bacterium]
MIAIFKRIFKYSAIFQGLLWFAFVIINTNRPSTGYLLPLLMAINSICFFLLPFFMDSKPLFKAGIFAFLAVNLILTFTDQMGFFDYAVMVLNITSLTAFTVYTVLHRKQNKTQDK